MRSRTSPKSRSWRPALRGLLASYLACFVGGNGLLGLAHLAFSDHRHVFCEEHGQFLDLPKTSGSARKTSSKPFATGQDPATVGALASTYAVHTACLFLNGRSFHASLQLTDQLPAIAPDGPRFDRMCPSQAGVAARPLLLSAPKTSPPVVAA